MSPFAGYSSFAACVAANKDKDDPEAYCAVIKRQVEGKAKTKRTIAKTWSITKKAISPADREDAVIFAMNLLSVPGDKRGAMDVMAKLQQKYPSMGISELHDVIKDAIENVLSRPSKGTEFAQKDMTDKLHSYLAGLDYDGIRNAANDEKVWADLAFKFSTTRQNVKDEITHEIEHRKLHETTKAMVKCPGCGTEFEDTRETSAICPNCGRAFWPEGKPKGGYHMGLGRSSTASKAGVAQLPVSQKKYVQGGDETQNPRKAFKATPDEAKQRWGAVGREERIKMLRDGGVQNPEQWVDMDFDKLPYGGKGLDWKARLKAAWKAMRQKNYNGRGADEVLTCDKCGSKFRASEAKDDPEHKRVVCPNDGRTLAMYSELQATKAQEKAVDPEFEKERKEHPSFSDKQIQQIVADHERIAGKKAKADTLDRDVLAKMRQGINYRDLVYFIEQKGDMTTSDAQGYLGSLMDRNGYENIDGDIKKKAEQTAIHKKELESQEILHGSLPTEHLARHEIGMKEYAELEACFLKEGDWSTNGIKYHYSWPVVSAAKETFKDKAFYLGHTEGAGTEYGLIAEVMDGVVDGENWVIAKIRIPETDFTQNALARIENGLTKYVSSCHSFRCKPGESNADRIRGKGLSAVPEGEIDGARILSIRRHIRNS